MNEMTAEELLAQAKQEMFSGYQEWLATNPDEDDEEIDEEK